MESWLVFALVGAFFIGFFSFGMKVIAQRNYNPSFASFIAYIVLTVLSAIYFLVNNSLEDVRSGLVFLIIIAFSSTLVYFSSTLTRVESMKNIDTTIFFPLYKTFMPIITTLASIFFFWESLHLKEVVGIVFGILIPLILITKKEDQVQKNLKLWVLLVIITSILGAFASIIPKVVHTESLNPAFFLFLASFSGTIVSWIAYLIWKKKYPDKKYSTTWIYKFWILLWVFQFIGFSSYVYSVEGNLAIAVTINSFSILIPIILSVIFYKEEMTKKKAFVIFLSIVSVVLFI